MQHQQHDYIMIPNPLLIKKRIHLYLMRHGQSQANVSSIIKKAIRPYHDPTLTRFGMEQAINNSQAIAKCFQRLLPHLRIYTSVLIRAQETALLAFPQSKICVSNHLKEEPNPLQTKLKRCEGENFPLLSITQQWDKMRRANIDPSRLTYETSLLQPDSFKYRHEVICTTGNVKTFLNQHAHEWKDGEFIILVIHGHLIRHFLGLPPKSLVPNGGLYEVFDDPVRRTLSIPMSEEDPVQYLFLYCPPQTEVA